MQALLLQIMSAWASGRQPRSCGVHTKLAGSGVKLASKVLPRSSDKGPSAFRHPATPGALQLRKQAMQIAKRHLQPFSAIHWCATSQARCQVKQAFSVFLSRCRLALGVVVVGPAVYGLLHLCMFNSLLFVAWSNIVVGMLESAHVQFTPFCSLINYCCWHGGMSK